MNAITRTILLILPILIGLVFIAPRCHKPRSHRYIGIWFADLGDLICKDFTRQYWLTGKVSYGKWENPLASSVMEEMEAPKISSIVVKPKGKPSPDFGVMSAEVEITYCTDEKLFPYEGMYFDMPVRGKDWYSVDDVDWSTGETKLYAARDNYIYKIAASLEFPRNVPKFQPVRPIENKDIPSDIYKDLIYRQDETTTVIRDLKEKKQYRFKSSGKKDDFYGTVEVWPIK